jgi:hypothetical protein
MKSAFWIEDVMTDKSNYTKKAICSSALIVVFTSMISLANAQERFDTAQAAANALFAAAKEGNQKAILTVLGKRARDIVSSGDAVADTTAREKFISAYEAKHSVNAEGDKATLIIGDDDYPFPIPLVHKRKTWEFDPTAGRQEILYRRIGRNELDAIQSCLAYVDAQNEYADKNRTGAGAGTYAQRIVSHPGQKDGLYWPSTAGTEQSPLGELVAQASSEGYLVGAGRTPYHGYYYRILTRQGPNAGGGAVNYVVRGKMIGGFALVAYPAEYGNSGVMTFMVNHNGVVYQKDLGPQTVRLASRISSFNPDQTWKKVTVEASAQ